MLSAPPDTARDLTWRRWHGAVQRKIQVLRGRCAVHDDGAERAARTLCATESQHVLSAGKIGALWRGPHVKQRLVDNVVLATLCGRRRISDRLSPQVDASHPSPDLDAEAAQPWPFFDSEVVDSEEESTGAGGTQGRARVGRGRLSETAARLRHAAGTMQLAKRRMWPASRADESVTRRVGDHNDPPLRLHEDALYDVLAHVGDAMHMQRALCREVLGNCSLRPGEDADMPRGHDGVGDARSGRMGYWEAKAVLEDARACRAQAECGLLEWRRC